MTGVSTEVWVALFVGVVVLMALAWAVFHQLDKRRHPEEWPEDEPG